MQVYLISGLSFSKHKDVFRTLSSVYGGAFLRKKEMIFSYLKYYGPTTFS